MLNLLDSEDDMYLYANDSHFMSNHVNVDTVLASLQGKMDKKLIW